MRQMIRWNKSGEVMVIDAEQQTATAALVTAEQSAPLGDYELDYNLDPLATDYTVLRER